MIRIYNRTLPQLAQLLLRMPWYFSLLPRFLLIFKNPFTFTSAGLHRQLPNPPVLLLRSGHTLFFSSCMTDVDICFEVFIKREYGKIKAGATIIDIGANIGAFSIDSAIHNAASIFAYEPSTEAFKVLVKNITFNHFSEIIQPFQIAVSDGKVGKVKFPKKSDSGNRIATAGSENDFDIVEAITLPQIIETNQISNCDLLKVDCEGSEYEILSPQVDGIVESLQKVQRIRMEYHDRVPDDLISFLRQVGFEIKKHDKSWRILWLKLNLRNKAL